ncbi:methylamine utilization protein MauJ [Pseudovibrio sp. POLY-S9]|uniref:methylamine utilization protein MauJ n=1 Tax=Pseudovibrio sp. POLY-S9 TaxID=1576596 RepID=UPI000708E0C4|nr:methylamine utilization protein MauJ [Pseudovibrio sp. POLY-S9]
MIKLELLEQKDIWTEELKRPGNWVVANIDTSVSWPTQVHTIIYEDIQYWIIPITQNAYPGITARAEGITPEELQKRILQLLSVISWVDRRGITLHSFTGGSLPHSMGRNSEQGYAIREEFDYPYLPEIDSDRAKLALALMREGRGLNHAAYAFLTFFRVLEVAHNKSERRNTWMKSAIERLENSQALKAVNELKASEVVDVAKHLYASGRCAIAHANSDPIINPDDPTHTKRLLRELPIIEALAVMAIEEELGIKTDTTIYREHLYELEGFKKAFGSELVERIKSAEQIQGNVSVSLPVISVRLRGKPIFASLEGLQPHDIQQVGTSIQLRYKNEEGSLGLKFNLNFKDERLEFDIHDSVYGTSDDNTANYAETKAQLIEFMKWYYLNGSLEIIDTETGDEISRKDAFLPENVLVNPTEFDKDIEFWRSTASKRRQVVSMT